MVFPVPDAADRADQLARLGDRTAHKEIVAGLDCLRTVDVQPPPEPVEVTGWLRVAVWNIERGRDPARIASLVGATGADVALLQEVDRGMARTSNRDVAREVASTLGWGVVFGVEFVELGLGKPADLTTLEGAANDEALHGNAILSRVPVRDPAVVRLDAGGDWFTDARDEPRVGGRMAVVGSVALEGVDVVVASVHLESHSDADGRATQMLTLLEAIDERTQGPVVIGGDLNTVGAPIPELIDRDALRRVREAEPARFSWPVPHEPLFEIAAARGYEWVDANLAAPTTRHGPDGVPDHHPLKLDWVLVRGVEARRPTVVPALAPDGSAMSDHELLAVSVRLLRKEQ